MKKKFLHAAYILFCAAAMAVFFVTTVFLSDIISWKANLWVTLAYLAVMAALYGALLIGSVSELFIKWGLSLPLSYLVINWFWETDFAVRSLNWAFPGYGRQSAGGGFAFGVLIMTFLGACLGAFIAALCISILGKPKAHPAFLKAQVRAGGALLAAVIIVTILLEKRFPTYDEIFGG